jgi:hypothetical protein
LLSAPTQSPDLRDNPLSAWGPLNEPTLSSSSWSALSLIFLSSTVPWQSQPLFCQLEPRFSAGGRHLQSAVPHTASRFTAQNNKNNNFMYF